MRNDNVLALKPFESAEATTASSAPVATILVVDDCLQWRTAMMRFLQQQGFHVIASANGEQAMVTMVENRVDLILLDLSMTPMDGLTFLQLFRRNVEWDNIPVIVMTGLSDGASFRHARQRGADKFIVKGQVAPADLLKHIQRRLGTQELLNAPGDGPDAFGGGSAFL